MNNEFVNVSLNDFISGKSIHSENDKDEAKSSSSKEKQNKFDSKWLKQSASKLHECIQTIDKNFHKIYEKNNLRVFLCLYQFIESLLMSCSYVFMKSDNHKAIILCQYILNYCSKESIHCFIPKDNNLQENIVEITEVINSEIKSSKIGVKHFKQELHVIKLQVLYKFAHQLNIDVEWSNVYKKLFEIKNPKITLVKDNIGLNQILEADQIQNEQLLDDIYTYICSQIENLDNDKQVYFRIQTLFESFSFSVRLKMYTQVLNDLEIYSSNEYSNKAYGLARKSRLYLIMSFLVDGLEEK